MTTLAWVMGASWVGKKTYMLSRRERTPSLELAWLDDSFPRAASDVVAAARGGMALVRWQWRREETIAAIAWEFSGVRQEIVCLHCDPGEHARRAAARADSVALGWTPEGLAVEARGVEDLARFLQARYELALRFVDVSRTAP